MYIYIYIYISYKIQNPVCALLSPWVPSLQEVMLQEVVGDNPLLLLESPGKAYLHRDGTSKFRP